MTVLNHIGICVTDLERSRRFYEELFGFETARSLDVPDRPTDKLLQIPAPLGMTALYLRKRHFTLELMCFERAGNPPPRRRPINEPGLTHLSFSVDDVRTTAALAAELGGCVLDETDVGAALFVTDPDGQLIELLPMSYRGAIGEA
jgi:catechol 2,3-dioxygenase-like lactoylglutathione lyase family enzyme